MIIKTCKKHGPLTEDKVSYDNSGRINKVIRCRQCVKDRQQKRLNTIRAARAEMRKEDLKPSVNYQFNFDLFMLTSNNLIKPTAQHYKFHIKYEVLS